MATLALLLATCRGTGKDLVIHKSFSPSDTFHGLKIKAGDYTLEWSNRDHRDGFALPPIVTVNGVALSRFMQMQRIDDVRVLQFPNETLYAFSVWPGGAGQNLQLMLVRLSDQEGVSVIGPTPQDDQFERFETTPIKEKDRVGSLVKFYIGDDKVAVYEYSNGGYLTKLQPAASLGGIWYQRYTATREAGIAEVIAAALEYKNLDQEAREALAGVIVSRKSQSGVKIYYSVDSVSYTYGFDRASIKLYIRSEGEDEDGMSLDSLCLVTINLRRKSEGYDYVIQSVTLTGIAG